MVIQISNTKDKKYQYAKILVLGMSGVGKTRFLGTVPESEMLIINVISESGMLTLKDKNITTIDVDSYEDMMDAIEWIKENGSKYTYIGVDSLSQFQKNMEANMPEGGNKFEKWRIIKENTKRVVDEFKRLPFHVVFTCELTKEKDEETGGTYYLPSLVGSAKADIEYWVDEVYFFTKRQAKVGEEIKYTCVTDAGDKYPCKSRAGLPMLIENPDLSEITSMMFGEIDKTKQEKDLKELSEADEEAFNKRLNMLTEIRETAKTIDNFDVKKFHKEFKTGGNLESLKDDQLEEALVYVKLEKGGE